jgi:hypothetical protein
MNQFPPASIPLKQFRFLSKIRGDAAGVVDTVHPGLRISLRIFENVSIMLFSGAKFR